MPLDLPPVYGYLDSLEREENHLMARGWLVRPGGPFDRFEVWLPGGQRLPAEASLHEGLKTGFPHVAGAERARFVASVPLPALSPEDAFEFDVVGIVDGGPAGCLTVGYHEAAAPQEFPPDAVMKRATGSTIHDFWRATGMKTCHDCRRILAPHVDLREVRRLLEWGCGSGRVTLHLIDRFPGAEVFGADIDAEAIAWAQGHLAGRFATCGTEPPLPYETSAFDLVISLSVFTHLTRAHQERWLEEMVRVLAPGGILLATTHGEFAGRWIFHREEEYERILASGFSDVIEDHNLGHVAGGDYYRATFQTRDFTEKFWGRWFEVLDFVEGGMNNFQDVWVLRPRAAAS